MSRIKGFVKHHWKDIVIAILFIVLFTQLSNAKQDVEYAIDSATEAEDKADNLDSRMSDVELVTGSSEDSGRIDDLESSINSVSSEVSSLKRDVNSTESDISSVRNDLDSLIRKIKYNY